MEAKRAKLILKKNVQIAFELSHQGGSKSWTFGRSNLCSFTIRNDPKLSRIHCIVNFDGQYYTIRDNQSRNGTFLNEHKIKTETRLKHGDVIRIGRTEMLFAIYHNEERLSEDVQTLPDSETQLPAIPGYRVLRLIGSGGMGSVLEGEQIYLKRRVAIKILKPDFRKNVKAVTRFFKEAALYAALSHPHIVQIYDMGEHEGQIYIVMEYIDGQTLEALIQSQGRLPVAQALAITADIIDGLGHAHQHKVIHRDLKPSNILIDKQGRAKLIDFGLAKMVEEHGFTITGQFLGTACYIAPEQMVNAKEVDYRADIYAVGATLYHMLCGQAPYADIVVNKDLRKFLDYVDQHLPRPLGSLVELPAPIIAFVECAMARNPQKRFASFADMLAALQKLRSP